MQKVSNSDTEMSNTRTNTTLRSTEIIVGYPNSIEIDLVPANELKHYELFNWLTLLFAPIAAGFWTADLTISDPSNGITLSAWIFTGVTVLFIVLAFYYRNKLHHESIHKKEFLDNFK